MRRARASWIRRVVLLQQTQKLQNVRGTELRRDLEGEFADAAHLAAAVAAEVVAEELEVDDVRAVAVEGNGHVRGLLGAAVDSGKHAHAAWALDADGSVVEENVAFWEAQTGEEEILLEDGAADGVLEGDLDDVRREGIDAHEAAGAERVALEAVDAGNDLEAVGRGEIDNRLIAIGENFAIEANTA